MGVGAMSDAELTVMLAFLAGPFLVSALAVWLILGVAGLPKLSIFVFVFVYGVAYWAAHQSPRIVPWYWRDYEVPLALLATALTARGIRLVQDKTAR
jgi:hypothetical protein